LSNIELFDVAILRKNTASARTMVDVKALKGDSSDNVPGVAGVARKPR